MTPVLYKENETDFNHRGLGSLNDLTFIEVTEEANGDFGLIMNYPANGKRFKEIAEFMFIKAKPNAQDEPHVFRIYETEKDMTGLTMTVYATSKTITDLQGNMVKKVVVNNSNPQVALNSMKANLVYPTSYDFYSDIATTSSTEWIRRNPLSCIAGEEGSLLHYWGGEIKRGNQIVSLLKRRGKDNVATIRYGKDLNGLVANFSVKGMVTRVLPYFTYTPKGSEDEVTVEGSFVDSQYINNYPIPFVKEVDFSNDDDVKDLETLNAKASKYFTVNTGIDKPSVNLDIQIEDLFSSSEYETKYKKLKKILLFDTITVYHKDFDINIIAKINKLSYDPYREKNTSIEAGSTRNTFIEDVKKESNHQLNEIKKELNNVSLSADGKNRINYGSATPVIANEGDLWYKPSGEFTIMYIFDGAYWQPVLNTEELDNVSKEVDAVLADMVVEKERIDGVIVKADQAITNSEANEIKADQAIAEAGFAGVNATEAKANAIEALGKANTAVTDSGTALTNANKAIRDSGTALTNANKAITDSGTAITNSGTALTNANKAITDSGTAITNSGTALTNANKAIRDSGTALTDSALALTKVGANETKVETLELGYNDLTKTVGLKADKTVVDGINGTVTAQGLKITANAEALKLKATSSEVSTLKGTVTTQGLAITANSNGIGLKADKTVVDTISGKVTAQALLITANSNGLTLKADKSVVDAISGTVTSQGLAITANSDGIGLKADKTVVDSISGTVATHTTQIKATSDGLALKAEKLLVDTINGTVNGHTTSITANANAIKLKADTLTVNSISGTVTTQGTAITANANAIKLKANQTVVDSISGTVTTQGTAITANANAIKLKAEKTVVDNLSGVVTAQGLKVTANANALILKAEKSIVDTINGTVGTHTTQIKANADGLKLKAEKTLVDTINGTVASQTLLIKANTDGLKLKAESSLVNTINGTVNTHTNQISANSTAISARLTSAQVDALVTGKKYVTETVLNATSKSLGLQITEVSTDLSNLEIGGRNYLLNSRDLKLNASEESELGGKTTIKAVAPFSANYSNPAMEYSGGQLDVGEYTFSFLVTYTDTKPSALKLYAGNNFFNYRDVTNWDKVIKDEFTRVYVTAKVTARMTPRIHMTASGAGTLHLADFKIEKGNKATDWTPAPEDMATVERAISIEANLNGLQTTVSNKANQSQVTQLAGQITSKVESSTYTSKMTQLDSAISSRVTSATYNSKMTQLDGQISSKVASSTYNSKMTQLDSSINLRVTAGQVSESILLDKKVKDTRNTNQTPTWYQSSYPAQIVEEFKQRVTMGVSGTAIYGLLTTKIIYSDASGGKITQVFSSADGVFTRDGTGTTWTAWTRTAEVENLVAQINLSPKGVYIQGKNIQLDGDVSMTTAFINSIKAIDISADRITAGTINAADVNIINLNASKIVASSLSALTVNTGALNVNGWLTMTTENAGMVGSFDYGDRYGEAYNYRWFTGEYRLSHKHLILTGNAYEVNSNNTRGAFKYYTETFYGPDYMKMRQYNAAHTITWNRLDINADRISMGDQYQTENIGLNADGAAWFRKTVTSSTNFSAPAGNFGEVTAPMGYSNIYFNVGRSNLADFRIGLDGSSNNGGRVVISKAIYNRTYGSAANMVVFDTGVIGRSVSASKYKLLIQKENLLETAKKVLSITPSSWYDKDETESIARSITDKTIGELDLNEKLLRHFGFIAEDFENVGAIEVVTKNSIGEVEGLSYDRISMYHHELIKDLYNEIGDLKNKIKEMESVF